MKDFVIEAVVDFVTPEWKAYISEWWRNLNYPTRIIIDKDKLILKDKKIKLKRSEFDSMINEFYWEYIDFFNLKNEWNIEFWDIIKIWWTKYMFIEKVKNWESYLMLFWRYLNRYWKDFITHIAHVDHSEIKNCVKTKKEIIEQLFWKECSMKDIEIIEDIDWAVVELFEHT